MAAIWDVLHVFGEGDEDRLGLVEEVLTGREDRPAGLVPQGDLVGDRVRAGVTGGPLERLGQMRVGQHLTGDPFGVKGVGLALAAAAGLLGGAGRAHVTDVVAGLGQEHRGVPAQRRGTLHAPGEHRAEAAGPGVHGPVPVAGHLERAGPEHATALVKHGHRQRLLVRVDAGPVPARVSTIKGSCHVVLLLLGWGDGAVDNSRLRGREPSRLLSSQAAPEGEDQGRHVSRKDTLTGSRAEMSQLLVQASDRKELPPPSGGPSRTPGAETAARRLSGYERRRQIAKGAHGGGARVVIDG